MKIFFWLLVAANVILFAVMKLLDGGQTVQVPLPMHQEKISIASAPQAVPVPPAPVAASAVETAVETLAVSAPLAVKSSSCYEWGDFSGAELEQVSSALKKLPLGEKLSQREIDRSIGFWVYIPPMKDKAAANLKIAQLKARGVTDYFVVQEAGEWQNAISLGVFKTREAAQNYLAALRAKNVSTAKMGERSGKSRATIFIINGLDAEISARLIVLQKDFSGSELKRVTCH